MLLTVLNLLIKSLLSRANLPTIHLCRLKTTSLESFKCINNIAPPYIRNLVNVKPCTYSLRYENTLHVPSLRTTTYGQKSFRFEAAKWWKGLPNNLRKVSNFREFERLIRTWAGPSCSCAVCRGSR